MKKKILIIFCTLVFFALIAMTAGNVGAKSLYTIAAINASPTPIEAYNIEPNGSITFQAAYGVPAYSGGAVGIGIDSDSATLFVTYEFTNIIQLLDATTMADLGTTTAPSASNLAGIVVDQDKGLLYTVDRWTDDLYIYQWYPSNTTLVLQSTQNLADAPSSFGIALDEINDILYVANYYSSVMYYDTDTWAKLGEFAISHYPQSIAVDVTNQLVYTGSGWGGYTLLSKYDLNTATETTSDIGQGVMGMAVDPATSLLYCNIGIYVGSASTLRVFDSDLNQLFSTSFDYSYPSPTGLCIPGKDISFNPLNLSKEDGIEGCISPGGTITYTITYDNAQNTNPVNNVVLNDTLPAEVTFISATDGGVYNGGSHSVFWNIGTLAAGAPQDSVQLTVQVAGGTPAGSIITNYISIDSDDTPTTTKTETTDVCISNDTTPPVTVKTVGDPKHGPNDEWVTSSTEFNMTATDDDSGVNATYYRIWYNGIWTNWTVYTGNFTLTGDCKHYIEFYSVDNVGNQEQIQNQTHYVDNTPPITDPSPPEFGGPYTTTEYLGTEFIMINCSTPMWINVTDPGCGIGVYRLMYSIWNNETAPGEYTKIPGSDTTVYDGGDGDLDGTVNGNISVMLTFDEGCFHEVRWDAEDLFGHIAHYDYDFAVDCTPPNITKFVGDPWYPSNSGEFVSWVNFSTPFIFNATDDGCNGGAGVARIGYEVRRWNYSTASWDILRTATIEDNMTGDEWDTYGEIQNITYMTEECLHEIAFWAEDYVGNRVDIKQKHKVDNTPPETIKEIGEPKHYNQSEDITYVTTQTPIWLNTTDHTDPCAVGCEYLHWEIWWKNEAGQWELEESDDEYDNQVELYFLEECEHKIVWWAVDYLGNKENEHVQYHKVDDTPPQTPKEIGEPKYGDGDMWVTTQTPIWLNTTDYAEPCAVGCEYLHWEIWWLNASGMWELKDWDDEYDNQAELYFTEECEHKIVWWAVDYLGNKEEEHNQTHKVDDTPPDIEKTVGTPQYTVGLPPGEYFVTSNTPIWINATDNGTDPCIVGSVNLTVTVDYQGVQTQYHTVYVEDGTASIGPIFLLGDCIHYVNVTAIDNLGNTKYHNEIFYVDNTPPESVKTFDGPTYPEDLNENGTIEPEEQHYWVTSETEITITAIDQADPCAVGVAGFHVTIWWDSDCDDIVDTLLFDDDIIDPYSFNFTFKELQEDYGNYGYIEGLYTIGWNSTDHLGNEEIWTEQYHKVDDTPPHSIIIKPVDGWYKDGSGIPSVVFAEDLTNPHGPCGLFDDGAVGIEDGRQGGGFLIDIFPSFNIIPLEGSNFTYDAASHEFIGNLVIPDPSGIPDGAVLFVANGSDSLGNGANSLLEILHAFFIQCSGDPGIFGDLIADFIANQNIVWIGIDNTSPSVDITEPEDGDEIGPNTVYITASMSDILSGITPGAPCYVTLDGISLGMLPYNNGGCQGTLPIPGQMPSGDDLPLEVSVYDNAGNEGSDVVLVDLNNQPPGSPTCAIISPANGTTHEGTIHVVIDAHDGETIEDDLIVSVKTSRQYDPDFIYAATYNGTSGYFHADIDISKYTDGAKIILQASATDEDNNTALSTWVECWVESTIVYDQWLTEGWNILTLPPGAITCDNSLEKALFSIYSDFDIAFYYDVPTDDWDSWVKGRPAMFNDLTEIYSGKTYFINITKAGGIRFYCDIYPPIVIIDDPEDGSVKDGMGNANIFAYDNESWITDVYVEIYDQNDSLYYNGSGWQSGQIWLTCNYTGGDEWTYDTDGIWTDDHIYTLTAMAYDAGGCTGVDSSTFTIQPED